MKIVCLIKTPKGGSWLVPQVKAMMERGHDVSVLLPSADGPLGTALAATGARIVGAPARFRAATLPFIGLSALRLRRLILVERADVLFYQLWASAVMGRMASLGLGRMRRVHMVPGPLFLEQPLTRAIERALVHLDDHVIAGSEHVARLYQQLGVPLRRLSVVAYGADLERFAPASEAQRLAARRELRLPEDAFVAVMVSYVYGGKRLAHGGRPMKGHADLLEAWRLLPSDAPPKRLLMVGGGFDRSGEIHRRELLKRYHVELDAEIRWLPTVADVRPFYRAADISVSPSLSENHGAAIEASAMGVPSIASDAGGLPEAVAGSGWVFPAGDVRVLARRLAEAAGVPAEELRARGVAARLLAEQRFDARVCAQQVTSIIERVAQPGVGRHS